MANYIIRIPEHWLVPRFVGIEWCHALPLSSLGEPVCDNGSHRYQEAVRKKFRCPTKSTSSNFLTIKLSHRALPHSGVYTCGGMPWICSTRFAYDHQPDQSIGPKIVNSRNYWITVLAVLLGTQVQAADAEDKKWDVNVLPIF